MLPENGKVGGAATGRNIDRLRIEAGLSIRDMQNVFSFATPQAIYKWIHGTSMPTLDIQESQEFALVAIMAVGAFFTDL